MDKINNLWQRLLHLYDAGEAKAVIGYVLEERFGLTRADVYCGKAEELPSRHRAELDAVICRLENAEPVQYVLGSAYFAGRKFNVRPGVLIPRPETEELCEWILGNEELRNEELRIKNEESGESEELRVLDVGTGSGCIAITLALGMPDAHVSAWDISDDAIAVARENAGVLGAAVDIVRQDALNPPADRNKWNIIVSNPPYIYNKERVDMERNVLDYEPHTALFVPDDNPLLFYSAIAAYAMRALVPGGQLYFEINPLCVAEMTDMLHDMGFIHVELRRDIFGKDRFMRAVRDN